MTLRKPKMAEFCRKGFVLSSPCSLGWVGIRVGVVRPFFAFKVDLVGKRLQEAKSMAIIHLTKNGVDPSKLATPSVGRLCQLLRLKYTDRTYPSTTQEKKDALIAWANTGNNIVLRSHMQEVKAEEKTITKRLKWIAL